MCSGNRHEYLLTIEMNKPFETHEHIFGNSWDILSMVAPMFSGFIVVLSGYVVNQIFCITLIKFVKGLPRYSCDLL